jgi:hypothetical protein
MLFREQDENFSTSVHLGKAAQRLEVKFLRNVRLLIPWLLLLLLSNLARRWSTRFCRLLAELTLIARRSACNHIACNHIACNHIACNHSDQCQSVQCYHIALTHSRTHARTHARIHAHAQSTFFSLNDGVVKTGGALVNPCPSCCAASALPSPLPPVASRMSGTSVCISCRCHCITAPTSSSSNSLTKLRQTLT